MDKMVLNEVARNDLVKGQDYLVVYEVESGNEIVFSVWDGDRWNFEDASPAPLDWATRIFESPSMDRVVSYSQM